MNRSVGYTCYIRLRTRPEKRDEFVRLISRLRQDALTHERGMIVYELLQGSDPNEFVLFEGFVDEAAQKIHQDAPYHVAMSAAGWACLDGTPVIEFLKPVSYST